MDTVLLRQDVRHVIEVTPAPETRIIRGVVNIGEGKVRAIERILETLGNVGEAGIIGLADFSSARLSSFCHLASNVE